MNTRNLRRFLSLTAGCAVSLGLGAYLSYQAASMDAGLVASAAAMVPSPDEQPSVAMQGRAAVADSVATASIASSPVAASAVSAAPETAESPAPASVAVAGGKDAPLVLAYADAGAEKLDLRPGTMQQSAAPQTLPPSVEPNKAAAQSPPPLPPIPPVDLAQGKPVPLPPRRPASLAALAPTPLPEAVAAPVAPTLADPQKTAVLEPAAAVAIPATPIPAQPVISAPPPSAARAQPPAQPQAPVQPLMQAVLQSTAPAAPGLASVGDALAAMSASVGGANAALPPRAEPPAAVPGPPVAFKRGSPVFVRIFKQDGVLEVWMKRTDGYALYKTYPICKWSGTIGPKTRTADLQSPEGFYSVSARQLNPNSHYHLAFDVGYPNAYDRRQGATGNLVMVHGDCKSVGCFAMTNAGIDEIYSFVADALANGQKEVPVHIFPFRMTEEAIARASGSNQFLAFLDNGAPRRDWTAFWRNLKQGYDLFERNRVPPVAYACGDRYEFGGAGKSCARIAGW